MARSTLRVTVGLDYGTHSVKCVLRTRLNDRAILLEFGKTISEERFPWFAEPSVIRLSQGRFWFGRKALAIESGELWRSLKLCLLERNGRLLDSSNPDTPFNVDVVIAAHLASVLQRISRALDADYGETHDVKLTLNVGAPMNHFVNPELRERYLQIINAAWEISFGENSMVVRNGVQAKEVVPLLCTLIQMPVPDKTQRKFEVLPETVAPIVSMSKDPSMDPGLYAMLDMGAGTTEMSVVFVADRSSEHRVSCYYDESHLVGGNDLSQTVPGNSHSNAPAIAENLRKLLVKITGRAFQHDSPNSVLREKWKILNLLYTGGAARHPDIQARCRLMTSEMKPYRIGESHFDCMWHSPEFAGCEGRLTPAESSLLAVANGLSYNRMDWPTFYEPAELIPETPAERIEKPEAAWYVND